MDNYWIPFCLYLAIAVACFVSFARGMMTGEIVVGEDNIECKRGKEPILFRITLLVWLAFGIYAAVCFIHGVTTGNFKDWGIDFF